jgi:hypothetical protein
METFAEIGTQWRQSEIAQNHSILLPIYAQMSEADLIQIAYAFRRELSRTKSISAKPAFV